MRLKYKKILITILLIMEIMLVNLTYQSFLHKEINKEENTITKKQFAMYIKENDEYVEYKSDNLFPKGYYVNKTLSKCVDENDNSVENVISSSGNNVTIISNKTVYCTLYFDKNEVLEYLRSKDTNGVLSEDVVGDMYRYQGVSEEYASDNLKVVDNNYLCLGSDCTEEGKDLYRIIGINENGELKVLKNSVLKDAYQWHIDSQTNIEWPDSNLFHRLNDYEAGTYKDSSFYSLLDNKLKEIIIKHDWLYGDVRDAGNYNGDNMYAIETGNRETTHGVKTTDGNYKQETYIWKNSINSYIGLQYIHDYLYAYVDGNPKNSENASKSWIFLNNVSYEWLMTRQGAYIYNNRIYYSAFDISGSDNLGFVRNGSDVTWSQSVRPVFYLTNDIDLIGEGTLTEPFEIDYEKTGVDIINSRPENLSPEEVGGMYRYQGTYEEVYNNYICLGDDCTEYGNDLYRIIGIANDGKIKVIKKTVLNDAVKWHNTDATDTKWSDSDLFHYLNDNSDSFYNSLDIKLKDKIYMTNWYMPETKLYEIFDASKIYEEEIKEDLEKKEAYIGLQYISDNLYSYPEATSNSEILNSWIALKANDKEKLVDNGLNYITWAEWTMTRYGLNNNERFYIRFIDAISGIYGYNPANYKYFVRPVFYIDSNTIYKGKGTLNYPYMIVK